MVKDANSAISNWSKGGSGKKQQYIEGIQRVSVNPMQLAAAQEAKMLANTTEAITSGRWASKLRSKPISDWSGPAIAKADNFVRGFTGPGLQKYTAFVNSIAPVWAQTSSAAKAAKAAGTGSTQRMVNNANAMRQWAGKPNID